MKNFPRLASRALALLAVAGGLVFSSGCKKDDTTTVLGDWTTGNSFAGVARNGAVSFVLNNIAYVGTGVDASNVRYNDLYSFNPATGSWNKLTPMPAAAGTRANAVAFTAAGRGYVGTGYDGSKALSDFWAFNPDSTTTTTTVTNGVTTTATTNGRWHRVADFSSVGTARYFAVAGSVSDVGYVGCGFDGNNEKDFYRYTPATNRWSLVNGFPGEKRQGGVTFTLNGQLYVCTGTNNGLYNTDVYSYNPASDSWSLPTAHRKLANVTTGSDLYDYSAVARAYAVAFTVNGLAYVVTGSNSSVRTDCFVYDPSLDTWTLKNPFLGAGRNQGVAFGIGDHGYVGTGLSGSARFDDFWNFAPDAAQE